MGPMIDWLRLALTSAAVYFLLALSALGTAVVWAVGGWDEPMKILVYFIIADYVLGFVSAAMRGKLSSAQGWRGILKKAGYFAVILVAHLFDHIVGDQAPLARTTAIMLLSANEGLSILENAGEMGVPLPKFLTDRIAKLREQLGGLTGGEGNNGAANGA